LDKKFSQVAVARRLRPTASRISAKQRLVAEWLGQEINGSGLHRLQAHRNVGTSGGDDDGRLPPVTGHVFVKLQTVDVGKADVEDQAVLY
jgi:hypothetical protein